MDRELLYKKKIYQLKCEKCDNSIARFRGRVRKDKRICPDCIAESKVVKLKKYKHNCKQCGVELIKYKPSGEFICFDCKRINHKEWAINYSKKA